MGESGVRERAGRSGAGVRALDLIAAKLQRPPVRSGSIRRSSLIEKLAREDCGPIVSVVAPAGYGKTTLLAQWAERSGHAFAWVQVDEQDNDPKVLLSYVAEALDAIEPVGERVFDALASPASSVPGAVVPRLCSAFVSMTVPVVLVLDDVHLLHNSQCRSALSVLADHVPAHSRLVFAGRDTPPVRVARLRTEGRIVEFGAADLTLTREEAAVLLRAAEVTLGEQEVAELHRHTEGWPVGLYLAALYLREGGSLPHPAASFGGGDRFVSDYVESELLARISREQREFLTRAAVLERMCGSLCEAALGLPGSAATLAGLAGSNLLLVPLDRQGEWYRYHHLFRDMLLAELQHQEPELMPLLRRRAADWCLRNGFAEEALEYSIAAGDVGTAARLIGSVVVPTYRQGRVTTIQRWFRWLDAQGASETHPMAVVLAGMFSALMGQTFEAGRLADAVDRWQYQDGAVPADPSAEAWAALLRAFLCRQGIKQMRADADEAVRRFAAERFVTPAPALVQGVARVLSGDLDGGDASLLNALSVDVGAPEDFAIALSERSLVAIARSDWTQAAVLAGQAEAVLRRAGIEEGMVTPLVCAVQARVAIHRRDTPAARQWLVTAQRTRPVLTYAIPQMAVQARIELARAHLALADIAAARTLMREIDEILRRRPHLGTLVGEAAELRALLAKQRGPSSPGASALTAAELRLLPLLSTHLTLPEIGQELFVSHNTVKSQVRTIYRKLGADSRSQAVAQARAVGLLEG